MLAVTLLDIEPDQYGYTVIVPGFGFLRDRFPDPYIVNWKLDRIAATSDQIPSVRVPIAAFMGSVGVLPGEAETDIYLKREAELGAAGGVGAAAAADRRAAGRASAGRRAATRTAACAPFRRARTAATWT